ncbi:hypothetical protein F4212_14905 [Candidatus Poribacteria bacterium]|nr:hypothetical protein [Candidatus Poribacteria bacterium]
MEFVVTALPRNASSNYNFESLSLFHENNGLGTDFSSIPVLRTDIGEWFRDTSDAKEYSEISLLGTIQDNSQLPEKEQRRYQELWHKCEYETLTETELAEYQTLVNELDTRNLKRLDAIIALAELRGKTIDDIIAEVGVKEENSVT